MIRLPVPPSTNNLFANGRNGGRFKTQAYKQWLRVAGYTLLAQRPEKHSGPVEITIHAPHNARRDLGNFEKPLSDLLVEHRIITDDRAKYIRAIHLYWHDDPDVAVEIKPFDEARAA